MCRSRLLNTFPHCLLPCSSRLGGHRSLSPGSRGCESPSLNSLVCFLHLSAYSGHSFSCASTDCPCTRKAGFVFLVTRRACTHIYHCRYVLDSWALGKLWQLQNTDVKLEMWHNSMERAVQRSCGFTAAIRVLLSLGQVARPFPASFRCLSDTEVLAWSFFRSRPG